MMMIGFNTACSSGSPSRKPDNPALFWAVARQSYRTGDLVKTDSSGMIQPRAQ
jgi:hypothetical protein